MTWKTQVFCSVKPRICFPYCLPGAKDAEGGWLYKAGRISQLIKATRPAATNVSHGTPESKKDAAASKTKKAKTSDESETGSSSTEADESSSGAKAHRRERKAKEEKKRKKLCEENKKRKHQKVSCPSQASSSKSKKAKKASKSSSEEEAPKIRVRRVARVGSDGRPVLTLEDMVTEVEAKDEELLDGLLLRVLKKQSLGENLEEWDVFEIKEDGTAATVASSTVHAKAIPQVLLVRKGSDWNCLRSTFEC